MKKRIYNERTWLNDMDSPSTGSIVCFQGLANWLEDGSDKRAIHTFVEIGDCHQEIRIHRSRFDSDEVYIEKLEKMRNVLDDFIEFLKG